MWFYNVTISFSRKDLNLLAVMKLNVVLYIYILLPIE